MDDFGKRLKSERERLGLNQSQFAELCGVGRTAQFNYERGERNPSSIYLDAAGRLGVDLMYVATGKRLGDERNQVAAAEFMFSSIAKELGLRGDAFSPLWGEASSLIPDAVRTVSVGSDEKAVIHTTVDASAVKSICSKRVRELTARSPAVLNESLLSEVLRSVEEVVLSERANITPDKKARLVVMVYRQAVLDGLVDRSKVRDAVHLAS